MANNMKSRIGSRRNAEIREAKGLCCDIAGILVFDNIPKSELALIVLGVTKHAYNTHQQLVKVDKRSWHIKFAEGLIVKLTGIIHSITRARG